MKLDHDLHVHTYLSACCHDEHHTPRDILALAEEMGIKTIAFTDHVWANPNLEPNDWYRPQDASQITKLREELDQVSTTVRVLVGCEAESVAPGRFGITPEFAAKLDFVLLACSHFHIKNLVAQPRDDSPRAVADHMLEFFCSGVTSGLADAIAHPLLPLGFIDIYDDAVACISDAEFVDAFGLAKENNVGIEITTGFLPGNRGFSIETPIRFLTLARETGCKFTLATDCHTPAAQRRLPELARITEAIGLEDCDMLMDQF